MIKRAYLFIIIGAALWGTIGWFVKNLYHFGFTPMEVVSLRAFSAAFILLGYMLVAARETLKLKHIFDIRYFIGTGIFSIIFFNFCMFTTIELASIPFATALLYTGPAFVTIMSVFFFREKMNRYKLIALFFTFIGVCFVVGLIPIQLHTIQYTSLIYGIGSGFGYALYSIISKFTLKKYTSLTITTYTFVVAAITLLPFFPFKEKLHLLIEPAVLFYSIGLGLLPTAFAYILYTYGLHQAEASKASILTTIEPVVATLIGIFIFHDPFSLLQTVGMASIIGAVILIQLPPTSIANRKNQGYS
ncbi:DMT family transporter [Virgibacillus soli]|uniref:DMT family transporter n=1 Tax=Paracerasibacillus soli TaxID=480284 RepID=UPI0035E9059B